MGVFKIRYPVSVHPEPGYKDVFCILDAEQRLVAGMMHREHADEVVRVLNLSADSNG